MIHLHRALKHPPLHVTVFLDLLKEITQFSSRLSAEQRTPPGNVLTFPYWSDKFCTAFCKTVYTDVIEAGCVSLTTSASVQADGQLDQEKL